MMGPIRVAVFEGDEIFRRGVVSCLDEDPVLEVVHQGAAYDEGSIDAPSSFDVAVVSAAVLEAALPTCPLVAYSMRLFTSPAYFFPASASSRPHTPRYGSGAIAWCTPKLCGTLNFHV